MVKRLFCITLLEGQWARRFVVRLRGVRRVGKTCLARSPERVEYFDCELPRVPRATEEPEGFLAGLRGKRIVLEEVQRLPNPAELLKIAADDFPTIRVLATGSSMAGLSARFRDALAGRKADVWLTPMIEADLKPFGITDLPHRLLRGGLPLFFLSAELPDRDFEEWMDVHWAEDIQELFRVEKRASFQRLGGTVHGAERRAVRGHPLRHAVRSQPRDHPELPGGAGSYFGSHRGSPIQFASRSRNHCCAQGVWVRYGFRVCTPGLGRNSSAKTWGCFGNTLCSTNCWLAHNPRRCVTGGTNRATKWILSLGHGPGRSWHWNATGRPGILIPRLAGLRPKFSEGPIAGGDDRRPRPIPTRVRWSPGGVCKSERGRCARRR